MKALTYHGSKDVRVENVPDPVLIEDDDIILRVTATAICGSDLHLYRGKVPGLRGGDILGRVVVPFTIACGDCFFCKRTLFAACETTNPGEGMLMNGKGIRTGAGLFGFTHLNGGYPGGQAEYVRVPKANVGPLLLPAGVADEKMLFLSDILPTG